eukprot:10952410-Alexandrium_andersonii.AAC.1
MAGGGLNYSRNRLGVAIHILAVVYAEPWPCSWGSGMKFWDSKIMTSEHMGPYLHDTCMVSPPARTFLKAGFGGMSHLKKVGVLYFTNAMGSHIPQIVGQAEE